MPVRTGRASALMEIKSMCFADNFHGTHLAGIVGARTDNRLGVAGVSPLVRIMACKFLDKNGDGYTSDAIRCMAYALQVTSFPHLRNVNSQDNPRIQVLK